MINPFDFLSMDELAMVSFYEDIDINSLIDNQENMSISSITRAEPYSDYQTEIADIESISNKTKGSI